MEIKAKNPKKKYLFNLNNHGYKYLQSFNKGIKLNQAKNKIAKKVVVLKENKKVKMVSKRKKFCNTEQAQIKMN